MAVTVGVSAGFVTSSPSGDPNGTNNTAGEDRARAVKDVIPDGYDTVTEIGFWQDSNGGAAQWDGGIYDHNVGDDEPEAVVGSLATNNTKSTSAGVWNVVSGLSIAVTAGTTLWCAYQCDNTAGTNDISYESGAGDRTSWKNPPQTALTSPWGSPFRNGDFTYAVYALVEAAATGTNMKIAVGNAWKEINAVQIAIGGSWKVVAAMQVNVGGVWKSIF